MKKVFLVLFIVSILFPLAAQQGKDVVLVVDTSSSMFSYYNEVGTYLSRLFLAENLSIGDTLHIISFGSKPRFEIARRILGEGDIQTASARIWLLYPLDPSSDPAAAINYTEQYTRSIQGERPKKVFFVSDSDLSGQVSAAAGRFPPRTDLQFIRATSPMSPGQSGVASGTSAAASGSGSTIGTGSAAGSSGSTSGSGAAGSTTGVVGTDSVTGTDSSGNEDVASDNTAQGTSPVGEQSFSGSDSAASETVQGNETGVTAAQTSGESSGSGFNFQNIPLPLIIAGTLLLLLLILFIILRMRKLQSSPKKAMAQISSEGSGSGDASNNAALLNSYASRQAEASLQGPNRSYHYRNTSNQFLTKPPMLNIFVEEQNTAIGRRNIHAMKKGATYTVGGGNSDFLIFLVHFPANIGRLYFDGTNCTFTPLKSEYFPDIGSAPIVECIGKPIRVISRKNYEVFFHFEPYKDPLVEMNQLLNSIKIPEPPSSNE
ncbi:MAG: VWA domain-containing protein [Treponema sp.]|nr:VWA domain-containing protein [Treponema sp.]